MPDVEVADLTMRAVLWPALGWADERGVPALGEPVEIMVNWKARYGDTPSSSGDTGTYGVTAAVDRPVPVGSAMWLGSLASWAGSGETVRVLEYWEQPDIRGRAVRRHVRLARDAEVPKASA